MIVLMSACWKRLPVITSEFFAFDRTHYPRFYDGEFVQKFYVPIQANYHQLLFPELAITTDLPLFPRDQFGPMLRLGSPKVRTPGNTIRKVYLCRAKTQKIRSGDLLFFYMSKDDRFAASQSVTTVGVVEKLTEAMNSEELIRITAKRSVFSAAELQDMRATTRRPVKAIDFLLIGHIDPFVPLHDLVQRGVFVHRPPQSITQLTARRYAALRPHVKLGFEI